jgi:hypothetical protein
LAEGVNLSADILNKENTTPILYATANRNIFNHRNIPDLALILFELIIETNTMIFI